MSGARFEDLFTLEEVDRPDALVGEFFSRRFHGHPCPDYPRHFVAFYKPSPEGEPMPVGYIHQTPWEGCYLCGGMVVEERVYRTMPAAHRAAARERGGIAEFLLRESFARVMPTPAIWGFVGEKQAEVIDLRVGFRHTRHPHLMVVWMQDLSEAEKAAWIERAHRLGPF